MLNIKRILSLVLALVMMFSAVAFTLTSCGGGEDPGTEGSGNPGQGDPGPGNGEKPGDSTTGYTITVKTEGGMLVSNASVYLHSYSNGTAGAMVDYGKTDANGKVTFSLQGDITSYAVKFDSALKGYNFLSHYPLVGNKLDVSVKTSLVDEDSAPTAQLKSGDVMFDFNLTDAFGNQIKLSDVLKTKKMVVLNFWYVNCSACQLEFPYMLEKYEEYKDDVAIIALNPYDDRLSISTFAQDNKFTFTVAEDKLGIYQWFGVENYPTSVVIDRYGMISLIEVGALPSKRAFDVMFSYYIDDNYKQGKVESLDSITPVEKPGDDLVTPSSDAISAALGSQDIDIEYFGVEEDEMSWPFIISEKNGETCIKTSNAEKVASYAQLMANVTLEAGDVVAIDYFASTELGADVLYILVNGKDIYSISGESKEWQTCYAYVALEAGTYEIAFVYLKDSDTDVGEDTVYLKNLQIVSEDDIDSPTYIYRYASNKPNEYGEYQEFADVYLGADGYYHVGSANGPLLLADLMGNKTHFSEEYDIYTITIGMDIEDEIVKYCNYASNSQIHGLCPVNDELKALLETVVELKGTGVHDKSWLTICCYYDSYGAFDEDDNKIELADPIKGLAPFSAYEAILNPENAGDDAFPNSIVYDRPIMPRGLFYSFVPEVSGVYQITSKSEKEVNAWIFKEGDFETRVPWLTYDKVDRMITDTTNCYMVAYLEKDTEYFINIAYYDVYETGTILFRVDYLGEEYYRFSLASPGFFTYHETTSGEIGKIIAGGIEVDKITVGDKIFFCEKRTDERQGSLLYADFTGFTNIFGDKPIYAGDNATIVDLIEADAFNFVYSEYDLHVLKTLEKYNNDKDAARAALLTELGDAYGNTYVDDLGNVIEGFAVEEVLSGIYHGSGEDYTARVLEIAKNDMIKVGYNELLGENIEEGDERIGCVLVTEELAGILQLLMDKYTFKDVKNSWTKLCYYHEYFGPEVKD